MNILNIHEGFLFIPFPHEFEEECNMEKNYVKVNGKEYAEKGIATGQFEAKTAVKFARIAARRGVEGEEIVTYTQNGEIEKVDTVKVDPETKEVGWVVTKLDENGEVVVDEFGHKNEWIVDAKTFAKKYEVDETKEGVYKPVGGPQIFVPIVMDVILEQWGGEMKIEAGGWLNITNPDDIYGISERDFYDTYRFVDDVTLTKTKKQNQ